MSNQVSDTSLLSTPEAERAVLAEILATQGEALMSLDFLKADHFAERAHRAVFEAARGIWETGGKADNVTVSEAVKDAGLPGAIATVDSLREGRSGGSVIDHARIIFGKWRAREVVRIGQTAAQEALTGDPQAVLDGLQREIGELVSGETSGFSRVNLLTATTVSERRPRVDCGIKELDAFLGGLVGGRLITIASRPGVGKTTLALNFGANVAKAGGVVAICSNEMSTSELVERLLVSEAQLPHWKLKKPALDTNDVHAIGRAIWATSNWKLHIDDTAGASVYEIAARAKKLKRDSGLDLLIVDYLQLLTPPEKSDNRVHEVAQMTRALKLLAMELEIPVVVMSQLSRQAEAREGAPRLSDLRESGSIEQDSDQVVFLWRDKENDGDIAYTNTNVAKNRHGSVTGDGGFLLGLIKDQSRFVSL